MQEPSPPPGNLTRRILLQALGATGIQAPFALNATAHSTPELSVDVLKDASTVIGEHFSEERLKIIEAALQQNLREFQIVHDLRVADLIEPAPVFDPTRRDQLPAGLPFTTGNDDSSAGRRNEL